MQMIESDIQALRESEFPITETWCYLDHASQGPLPASHVAAVSAATEHLMRSGDSLVYETIAKLDDCRRLAATLVNAAPADIALLTSTGQGIGLVAQGLDWQDGDEMITYAGEFPSVVLPWLQFRDRGVRVRFVEDRGCRYDAEDVEALISDRTRVIALSLVNFAHGFRAPIETVAEMCRARGIWLVVDVAQGLGVIPVDAEALGADILSAQAYKHLLGGFGISVCYCSPRTRRELRVAGAGWAGREPGAISGTDFERPLSPDARRFETSHPGFAAIRGLLASLRLLIDSSPALYQRRIADLADQLVEGLQERGWVIAGSLRAGERSSIVSATRPGVDLGDVHAKLHERRIACSHRAERLRFAPHFYNTADDLSRLFGFLDECA
jgi:cysteine desulfurase/selenocysteine lyase